MTPEEIEFLNSLLKKYGVFGVVENIHNISELGAKTDYEDNPDAIIHTDTAILEDAVDNMINAHPLRLMTKLSH